MKAVTSIILTGMLLTFLLPAHAGADEHGATDMPAPPDPNTAYRIDGAGSSFPFPLIDKWRVEIGNEYPNFKLNYQSTGSGGGIKDHIESTISFAGTDTPLTKNEFMEVGPTLHIPEAIGAVSIVYNLPGQESVLKLTGQTAADIFAGKITAWNDQAIADINPGLDLPDEDILIIHRSDGSGTTMIFTKWLSEASSSWSADVGAGKSVQWPVGAGAIGSEGVTETVLTTPYSIGYVSLAYVIQTGMTSAAVENGDGTNFVIPELETIASAAESLEQKSIPPAQGWWNNVDLLNAPGYDSYPIASLTYLLVYEDVTDAVESRSGAEGLVWMIHWMITHGQIHAPELGFVPLPDEIVEIAKNGLGRIRYDGNLVWDYNPVRDTVSGREVRIDAAGASFAFPLMDLWRVKYAESHPNISLNYQSIGSGGGVKQHIEKTIDFAASDAPLRDSEYGRASGTITIPEMIGAVSITYNVPGIPDGLKLTAKAVCNMYLGKITEWNDPEIAGSNPGLDLPDEDVLIAQRSDGSGTTFAFTGYLAKTCPEWDERVGAGKSVQWPVGRGAPGNEGVAGIIKSTEGAIGYITLAYAFQEEMHTAAVQNGDGTNFVMPTLASASAASEGAAPGLPEAHESWRGVDLLAAPGENSYPITTFSYILLHPTLDGSVKDYDHAREVGSLIAWIITDGQKYNADLLYVPISVPVTNIGLEGLSRVTYQGQPIYDGPTNIGEISDDPEAPEAGGSEPRTEAKIPSWVKDVFAFYMDGNLSDDELIPVLQYLIQEGIIRLE